MEKKPNVLFIYPDQLRYDCMGHTGNNVIKTPGFDRLADEGVSFSKAYTSFPLCCPFRASIFSGKYAHQHGLYANHYPLPLDQKFLPELMSENGYKTGWIGKWHLSGGEKGEFVTPEYQIGFDEFVGFSRGHVYNSSIFYRNDDPSPRKRDMYEPEFQTEHLFEFIKKAKSEDKPFFAGICYGLPHPPLDAPDHYLDLYSKEEMEIPDTVPEDQREEAAEFLRKYYGLVSCVDNQVMRVLNWLDYQNLSENTLVIFVSDHGEMAGEHGKYGKRSFYDASMHVPFLMRYPKLYKNKTVCDQMVDPSVDIFATILDVCDIEIPDFAEGESLKDLSDCSPDRDIYYQIMKQPYKQMRGFHKGERGIRDKEYFYIGTDGEPAFLFDLKKDPDQKNNLAGNADYSEVTASYRKKLENRMNRLRDDWSICYKEALDGYQSHEGGADYVEKIYDKALLEHS